MSESAGRGPGVRFPPPFVFVAGFVVGWLLDRFVFQIRPVLAGGITVGVGVCLLIAGLCLMFWGLSTFHRMKTAIFPNRDASMLVIAGPYKWTRNPMYSGMTLVYLGLCLMLNMAWSLVLLPIVLFVLYKLVIAREENYLTAAFGDQYRRYQDQVGRWF